MPEAAAGVRVMVAYSFQPRFVAPIQYGTKRQTIRAHGKKRHAQAGEELQLYCRQRHPSGFLIGRAICLECSAIALTFLPLPAVYNLGSGERFITRRDLNAFASGDGFEDWQALHAFWRDTHGPENFSGVIVRWRDFEQRKERA